MAAVAGRRLERGVRPHSHRRGPGDGARCAANCLPLPAALPRSACFLGVRFARNRFVTTETAMAKFVTVGYGDKKGYERTDPSVRDAAHAHDARLKASGALIGIAGDPVQVRNHDDFGVKTVGGSYMHSALPIAGFAVIEAKDLQEAISLASKAPCAVAHGVVEIWPLNEMP